MKQILEVIEKRVKYLCDKCEDDREALYECISCGKHMCLQHINNSNFLIGHRFYNSLTKFICGDCVVSPKTDDVVEIIKIYREINDLKTISMEKRKVFFEEVNKIESKISKLHEKSLNIIRKFQPKTQECE